MVKVRRTEAKKGEGSVGAASCFHLHCSLPWKTILTSLETFPKQVGDSCLELIPYPLSLCWKHTTYLLSGLKGWWLSPWFQGLWPISRATLKGSTVSPPKCFPCSSFKWSGWWNCSLWLPWESWFITSISTSQGDPSRSFSKASVQTGSHLSSSGASWLHSGPLPCPLAVKATQAASLQLRHIFHV